MNSEDELISVMAHEVGHVVRRHLASRMKKGKVINFASMGAALAAIALGGGAAAQGLLAGSLAAGQSAQLHFSRQDEIEADLLAYQWMQDMLSRMEADNLRSGLKQEDLYTSFWWHLSHQTQQ